MKITISPSGKQLHFEKYFTSDHILSAECIGMKVKSERSIVCDIRVTCKKSLFLFVELADKNLMKNPNNLTERDKFIKLVNGMYREDALEFLEAYKPYELYNNVNRKLNKYQVEGLWMFRNRQYNLCAFEQGLGKTVFAASISKLFCTGKTLIICPAVTKWNWFIDLTEDWGYNNMFFSILDSERTMNAIMQESFIIVNYESIGKFYKRIFKENIDHIIIDESHYIKTTTSTRFKAVKATIKNFPKARVTFLSGTPIKNRITDMFAPLNLAGIPIGQNFLKFKARYAKGDRVITGVKNPEEFRLNISNFMLRKKSSEELNLPELNINRYYFAMDDKSTKKYNDSIDEMYNAQERSVEIEQELKDLRANGTLTPEILKNLNHEHKVVSQKAKSNIMSLNRICAESKIPNVIKLVNSFIDQGDKVLVFSFFNGVLEGLQDYYKNSCVLINGSVSSIKRRDTIEKFKKKKEVNVFLGQVIAAGIGINLTNANKVIFCDLGFTPDLLEQPYKRAHRQGQLKDVEVIYAMIPGSIDERIFNLIESKTDDINEVIDHGKSGNVVYANLEKKLFNSLLKDYEVKHNINKSIVSNFQKV